MKKTPLLESVLSLLKQQKKPISVPEIQEKLAEKSLTPNKTTLYRMLERLESEQEVEPILLDSKITYYELKTSHHHHHFCCEICKKILCISDSELEKQVHLLEEKLLSQGFLVNEHHFSFSGKCPRCVS